MDGSNPPCPSESSSQELPVETKKKWTVPRLPSLLDDYAFEVNKPVVSSNAACATPPQLLAADSPALCKSGSQTPFHGIPAIPWKAILHGDDLMSPYSDISSFPFKRDFNDAFNTLRIAQINSLQRCTWPHVIRGRNCFIIGGISPHQGKTLAYLVPIAAKIIKDAPTLLNIKGFHQGPLAIILCASLKSAMKIEYQLETLFKEDSNLKIYRASKSDLNYKSQLWSNPSVIICKPDFVLFALENCSNFFGFHRLRYLIVDDSHLLLDDQLEHTNKLLQTLSHELKMCGERCLPLQFIFCGQEWNEGMKQACTGGLFNNPVLIIGSFIEPLVYGNVKLYVTVAEWEEKIETITQMIQEKIAKSLLIVCNTRATVVNLGEQLSRNIGFMPTFIEAEYGSIEQMRSICRDWDGQFTTSSTTVLIVTDQDLNDLQLKNVTTVIHFEMPEEKLDAFGERHIGMWNLFPDNIKEEEEKEESASAKPIYEFKFQSHVFIEPDDPELSKIVVHLKRINAIISPELEALVQQRTFEELKSKNMCSGMNLFGKCNAADKRKCQRTLRHFFTLEVLAAEATVPSFENGRVDVQILKCLEANYYQAKVLNFYQVKKKCKTNNISYLDILNSRHEQLGKFFEDISNRIPVIHPTNGTLYAIKFKSEEAEFFTRAQIIDSVIVSDHETNSEFPFHYRLWCVDIGEFKILSREDIFILPEEYHRLPSLIINIIIANMKPIGDEEKFRSNKAGWTRSNAKDILQNKILTGIVCLSIGDTIWVKSLVECRKNSDGDWIQELNVRTEFLVQREIGEDNPTHLPTLYHLCENEGFDCSIYKSTEMVGEKFQGLHDPFSSAWLSICSPEEPITISMVSTFVASPHEIYAVHEKYEDLLDDLIVELTDEVNKLIKCEHPDYHLQFATFYEEGLCVAAKDFDNYWQRAIILHIRNEDGLTNQTTQVNVFYVDQGEKVSLALNCIFPLPKEFVQRLPFQAICLRLNHVETVAIETDEEDFARCESAKDFVIDELVRSGAAVRVDVIALQKNIQFGEGAYLSCNSYDVFLLGDRDGKELGESLVEQKLAKYKPGALEIYETTKRVLLAELNKKMDELGAGLGAGDGVDSESEDDNILMKSASEVPEDLDDKYLVNLGNTGDGRAMADLMEKLGFHTRIIPKTSTGTTSLPASSASDLEEVPSTKELKGFDNSVSGIDVGLSADKSAGKTIKTPFVKWSQTKTTITLTVDLADIKKYEFKIQNSQLLQFTSFDPPDYTFSITTFGKVIESSVKEILTGYQLVIKLNKLTRAKWISVQQKNDKKQWWLRKDYEKVSDSSDYGDDDDDEEVAAANEYRTHCFGKTKSVGIPNRFKQFSDPAAAELALQGLEVDQLKYEEESEGSDSDDDDAQLSELEDFN